MSKLSPEQIEANQQKLLQAALKGKASFDAQWDRMFPPESPTSEAPRPSNSSPAE